MLARDGSGWMGATAPNAIVMNGETRPTGPLAGVKVVELCIFMAGPTCGCMLADLGADVVKVERIPDGDDARFVAAPKINGESSSFMIMNRNKRGIAVDLKKPGGLKAMRRLLRTADIVIENFRPGVMERLGLGYEELRKENSALIFGSISGFGHTGPLADRSGLDLIAQAFSGVMSITGEGPGRPPVKVGPPISDTTSGMLLALGVVAAYVHRLRTGEGQKVETSLLEGAMSHLFWQAAIFFANGDSGGPLGSAHPITSPYQAYRCSDGYLVLGAANATLWAKMLDAIDAAALAHDPRFSDIVGRRKHNDALTEALETVFERQPRAHWIERLEKAGVPCGPVNTIGEAFTHPHVVERQMAPWVDHPNAGHIQTLGCPVKFSRTQSGVHKAAPLYGEDTIDVLREHGYSKQEIDDLVREGAVQTAAAASISAP